MPAPVSNDSDATVYGYKYDHRSLATEDTDAEERVCINGRDLYLRFTVSIIDGGMLLQFIYTSYCSVLYCTVLCIIVLRYLCY